MDKTNTERIFNTGLYIPESLEEEISTWFYKDFTKSLKFDTFLDKMESSVDGENIKFSVKTAYHYLLYSYLCFKTPNVKVKREFSKKVRIAWCHNLGTNVVIKAIFKNDNDVLNTITRNTYDNYFQFMQIKGNNKKFNHDKGIGNIPVLENWNEDLPEYQINVYQPWYYGEDTSLAFPIYHKKSNTKAEHNYTFEKDIKKLLRVQILNDMNDENSGWKNIESNSEKEKYIEISYSAFSNGNIPELWGKYSNVTEEELETYNCREKERFYYYRDFIEFRSENDQELNKNISVDVKLNNPITNIFWNTVNKKAESIGNFSNYTTNHDNLNDGIDPIKNTTLDSFFKEVQSHHFNIAESRNLYTTSPTETGYHTYSFSLDNSYISGAVSTQNLNTKMVCSLENVENNKDTFQLILIACYYRKMTLSYDNNKNAIFKII